MDAITSITALCAACIKFYETRGAKRKETQLRTIEPLMNMAKKAVDQYRELFQTALHAAKSGKRDDITAALKAIEVIRGRYLQDRVQVTAIAQKAMNEIADGEIKHFAQSFHTLFFSSVSAFAIGSSRAHRILVVFRDFVDGIGTEEEVAACCEQEIKDLDVTWLSISKQYASLTVE